MQQVQIIHLLNRIIQSGGKYDYSYDEGEDGTIWFSGLENILLSDLDLVRLNIKAITLYLKHNKRDLM